MRFPTNVRKLFSSVPSSFNRVSVASFCPSIALGIRSRKWRISSAFRLESSSLFLSASFNELSTDSSSPSAESKRVVRLSSAAFKAVVSVFSCSRRSNAFSNDLSISVLSCSSWGGVGGLIRGIMYRYMLLVFVHGVRGFRIWNIRRYIAPDETLRRMAQVSSFPKTANEGLNEPSQ